MPDQVQELDMAARPYATERLLAFLQQIERETDVAHLGDTYARELRRQGFGGFSLRIENEGAVILDGRQFHGLSTYTREWEEHFLARNYFVTSPVFRLARVMYRPFNWFEILAQPWISRSDKYVFDEAAEFDIGIGLTVPIHLPRGRSGVLTVTSDPAVDPTADIIRAKAEVAHLLGFAFFEKAGALIEDRRFSHPGFEVTGRHANDNLPINLGPTADIRLRSLTTFERDCLAWAAEGLSDWTISERFCFPEAMVSSALESARIKLGAASPTHAVVRAIVNDLIAI